MGDLRNGDTPAPCPFFPLKQTFVSALSLLCAISRHCVGLRRRSVEQAPQQVRVGFVEVGATVWLVDDLTS
jgi:hypothetical protein